jgi:hypothetical protein
LIFTKYQNGNENIWCHQNMNRKKWMYFDNDPSLILAVLSCLGLPCYATSYNAKNKNSGHFFLFIFWWHQIFSFPFCFSLLVFSTLQWHIYIICSRENLHEKNIFLDM